MTDRQSKKQEYMRQEDRLKAELQEDFHQFIHKQVTKHHGLDQYMLFTFLVELIQIQFNLTVELETELARLREHESQDPPEPHPSQI